MVWKKNSVADSPVKKELATNPFAAGSLACVQSRQTPREQHEITAPHARSLYRRKEGAGRGWGDGAP